MAKCCLLLLLLLSTSACAYRVAAPFHMPQGVSITIVKNQARLVRLQTFMHQAIADSIERDLGWSINGHAPNQLEIKLAEEDISEAAHDAQEISRRWRIRIELNVTLKSPYVSNGAVSKRLSAAASNSTLADESAALQDASRSAADQIRSWLESIDYRQPPTPPAPAAD